MSTLSITSNGGLKAGGGGSGGTDNSRTTRLLLVVIVLFVVTELPQAVLLFLSINLRGFFRHVYMPLGDAMDIVALVNNGVNFVLYCSMSRDFRNTVVALIKGGVTGLGRRSRGGGGGKLEDLGRFSCRSSSLRPPCSPLSRASTTTALVNGTGGGGGGGGGLYLGTSSGYSNGFTPLSCHSSNNEHRRSHSALVVRLSENSSAETVCAGCHDS